MKNWILPGVCHSRNPRLWEMIHFPSDLGWVAAEVEDRSDKDVIPFDLIEDRVWEALGKKPVEASEMDRVDVGIKEE